MDLIETTLKLALPSAKLAYRMMAVSAEVLCRHSFGQRYAPQLIGSFLLALLYAGLQGVAYPGQPARLIGVYVWIHFALVCYHLARNFRPRNLPLHSYSSGQSWSLWQRHGVRPGVVQLLIEPGLVVGLGAILYPVDIALSFWLQIAGLCLFVKEMIAQWQQRNRMFDALDARAEGERMNTGIRQAPNPEPNGEQATTPVTAAMPVRPAVNQDQQITRNLDPALQRLMATGNPPAAVAPPNAHRPRRQQAGPIRTPPRIIVRRPPRP
jgi:hypothetical protein